MSDLRTAAQQALEALDWYAECAMVSEKAADAASALRAALVEPTCATQDCMPSKCSLAAQNTEQDRVLVEMEHALVEAEAIMEEVDEETADAWRKRWGRLWGRPA